MVGVASALALAAAPPPAPALVGPAAGGGRAFGQTWNTHLPSTDKEQEYLSLMDMAGGSEN